MLVVRQNLGDNGRDLDQAELVPEPSCTFSIWKTGALSIELGPEPGNCIETFLEVELSTIARDFEERREFDRRDLEVRGQTEPKPAPDATESAALEPCPRRRRVRDPEMAKEGEESAAGFCWNEGARRTVPMLPPESSICCDLKGDLQVHRRLRILRRREAHRDDLRGRLQLQAAHLEGRRELHRGDLERESQLHGGVHPASVVGPMRGCGAQ